jgi:hypothetical protein
MPLKAAKPVRYVGHHLVFPRYVRQRRGLDVFARWLLTELKLKADLSI